MKAKPGDTFPAARWLIGARVEADGKQLGHVIDLEVDPKRDFEVSALELGRFGWLDRLHILRPIAHGNTSRVIRVVAWGDVERVEGRRVVCRPGTKVTEQSASADDQPPQPGRTAPGG